MIKKVVHGLIGVMLILSIGSLFFLKENLVFTGHAIVDAINGENLELIHG
ncbi:hypothetical protein HOD88_00325 [archaeon]|jgi:hypothetical protein|nr:hypothetical protein [archaeon]